MVGPLTDESAAAKAMDHADEPRPKKNKNTSIMKKNLLLLASALVLTLAFALGVRAEEKAKEKMKSAEKPAKEMNYTADCPGPCEFSVKSHDKAEVAAILKDHARAQHHIEMSDQDLETAIKAHTIRKEKAKE